MKRMDRVRNGVCTFNTNETDRRNGGAHGNEFSVQLTLNSACIMTHIFSLRLVFLYSLTEYFTSTVFFSSFSRAVFQIR